MALIGRLIDELLQARQHHDRHARRQSPNPRPGGRVADRAPRRPQGRIRYYESAVGPWRSLYGWPADGRGRCISICSELVTGSVRWEDGGRAR